MTLFITPPFYQLPVSITLYMMSSSYMILRTENPTTVESILQGKNCSQYLPKEGICMWHSILEKGVFYRGRMRGMWSTLVCFGEP